MKITLQFEFDVQVPKMLRHVIVNDVIHVNATVKLNLWWIVIPTALGAHVWRKLVH